MQFVPGKDNKGGALLVSKNEWKRLQKLINKKDDDRSAVDEKDERRALSKAMTATSTTLV